MGTTPIIIANGQSLKGAGNGSLIDDYFSAVIKLGHNLRYQIPEDCGFRADYVVTTFQNHADIINEKPKAKQIWLWTRPGWWDESLIRKRIKGYDLVFCYETDMWATRFQNMGARAYVSHRDPNPIFSSGLAAIIITAERLKPKTIHLAGFDMFTHLNEKNKHDVGTEYLLLKELKQYYGFETKWFQ